MKWVTPLLLVGTAEDAAHRGEVFATTPEEAIAEMDARRTAVVSTREIAAACIRHFGASEDWIHRHVMSEWGEFSGFDSAP